MARFSTGLTRSGPLMFALCVLGATCGAPAAGAAPKLSVGGSWPYSNADLSNSRDAVGSTITLDNVAQLKEAWSFKLSGAATGDVGGYGTLAANPIVVNNVVFIQDLHSNVYALSLGTGKLDWTYQVDKKEKSGPGPNGVAVVDGMVYGATPTTVFSLNETTGHVVWTDKHLLKKGQGTFGIQPQVANGRVYLASQYGEVPGGGLLLALNATNGHVEWSFKSVPQKEVGVEKLGLGAGGAWETPLVGTDGSVTFGTGNPYQYLSSAINTPGKLLYTDSDVNLDAATGKLRWYYQGVTNDFKDYDMQASPISTSVKGTSVVIGGGKMGVVYEMNATSGALIWKTPVGEHNGHDGDSLNALDGKKLRLPLTYLPGALGGILTNMAVAGNTLYVATCNLPFRFTSTDSVNGSPVGTTVSGDIEALNVTTGRIEWKTAVKSLPLGATTVANNVVFTTLISGELIALNTTTGAIVFSQKLPRTANSPIVIAGDTVIVPVGGPTKGKGNPSQIIAYRVP